MHTLRRAGWLLLSFLVVGASLALTAASEEIRAGIVTGLQGTARVMRASLTEPRELKFRDDVYLHDEIVTGEDSLARILLGGKALLTVRERSRVRITEVPGRSTVAVSAGRAAINVLKERMRPGDTVEISTPTATAAIRGTIVVAEVEGDGADARSTITVLRGVIDVTRHDLTGRPLGHALRLAALQQVRASRASLSGVHAISRQAADRMANDFRMTLRPAPPVPSAVQTQVDQARRALTRGSREAGGDRTAASPADTRGGDDKAADPRGGTARGSDPSAKGNDAKSSDARGADGRTGDGVVVDVRADVKDGDAAKGADARSAGPAGADRTGGAERSAPGDRASATGASGAGASGASAGAAAAGAGLAAGDATIERLGLGGALDSISDRSGPGDRLGGDDRRDRGAKGAGRGKR